MWTRRAELETRPPWRGSKKKRSSRQKSLLQKMLTFNMSTRVALSELNKNKIAQKK